MAYPDTDLPNDTLDALYGGRPALEWGALAWQWANNLLRFLGTAHLAYNRVTYRTVVAKVSSGSLAPGDVAVFDMNSALSTLPTIRKAVAGDSGSATMRVFGVCIVGASVGSPAVLATSGIVPRVIAGFASNTAAAQIAVDYTTGRLKVAGGGDPVVGLGDLQGNVLLRLEA